MQSLPDKNELMKLAESPAGQQLIALLKSKPNLDLGKLAQEASSGNYAAAKTQLSELLGSNEVQLLLRQLEKQYE